MLQLSRADIERIVDRALDEDAPFGDLTSQVFVPADATATADLSAREPGVFAGAEVLAIALTRRDQRVEVRDVVADGARFAAGDVLAVVHGPARSVLQAERVALNLVQRMCGTATLTARYTAAVAGATSRAGHPVRIADTRKTTPGLRLLDKHAVRCGGGHNHRFSLSDAVMAKDNHLAVAGDVTTAIRRAADQLPHTVHLEVEVDRAELIEPVLSAGVVGTIMLDNFSLGELRAGVEQVAGRALVEASGGVTLETVAEIAATGVDVISVGALTHSAPALDLGLDVRVGRSG